VLEEAQFPPGTFDGDGLLREAREKGYKIETY
jgi:hypothetical protein